MALLLLFYPDAKHYRRKENKQTHLLESTLIPIHSFPQSACLPNSHSPCSSPSSVTGYMDLSAFPLGIEAKTKTYKKTCCCDILFSHLNARQSQWTGVWGICVHITMAMALCLPRLP